MPGVVEACIADARCDEQLLPGLPVLTRTQRLAGGAGEHQAVVLPQRARRVLLGHLYLPLGPQLGQQLGRDAEGAPALGALGLYEDH